MSRGFTLIEILLVLAIMSVLLGLGLFATVEGYKGSVSRSEREMVVSLLERARSRAMANVAQSPWGLCYMAPNYLLFKGGACVTDGSSETLAAGSGVEVIGLDGVAFAQLSGTTTGANITIKQNGRNEAITINHEGTIVW